MNDKSIELSYRYKTMDIIDEKRNILKNSHLDDEVISLCDIVLDIISKDFTKSNIITFGKLMAIFNKKYSYETIKDSLFYLAGDHCRVLDYSFTFIDEKEFEYDISKEDLLNALEKNEFYHPDDKTNQIENYTDLIYIYFFPDQETFKR